MKWEKITRDYYAMNAHVKVYKQANGAWYWYAYGESGTKWNAVDAIEAAERIVMQRCKIDF